MRKTKSRTLALFSLVMQIFRFPGFQICQEKRGNFATFSRWTFFPRATAFIKKIVVISIIVIIFGFFLLFFFLWRVTMMTSSASSSSSSAFLCAAPASRSPNCRMRIPWTHPGLWSGLILDWRESGSAPLSWTRGRSSAHPSYFSAKQKRINCWWNCSKLLKRLIC